MLVGKLHKFVCTWLDVKYSYKYYYREYLDPH